MGNQLCLEAEFIFASNLFNTGSLWEFHKLVTYRIMSLKPIMK